LSNLRLRAPAHNQRLFHLLIFEEKGRIRGELFAKKEDVQKVLWKGGGGRRKGGGRKGGNVLIKHSIGFLARRRPQCTCIVHTCIYLLLPVSFLHKLHIYEVIHHRPLEDGGQVLCFYLT
jgi:hypothetical protein